MNNILETKSYAFALRIVKLQKYLHNQHKEFTLSNQVLRSGTAIGALVREAQYAESKPDFIHKLSIALKEAHETEYWLSLLKDSEYITENDFKSINPEIKELLKLLISSINTSKKSLK